MPKVWGELIDINLGTHTQSSQVPKECNDNKQKKIMWEDVDFFFGFLMVHFRNDFQNISRNLPLKLFRYSTTQHAEQRETFLYLTNELKWIFFSSFTHKAFKLSRYLFERTWWWCQLSHPSLVPPSGKKMQMILL